MNSWEEDRNCRVRDKYHFKSPDWTPSLTSVIEETEEIEGRKISTGLENVIFRDKKSHGVSNDPQTFPT